MSKSKQKVCSLSGCDKPRRAKGYCMPHYMKMWHHGDPTISIHERHGKYGWPEYNTWQGMKRRCNEFTHPKYPRYGGRGIKVCDRWKSFDAFIQDMGRKPKGHTLDRIDNDGDYCPENCRWATQKTQQNNRSNNMLITYNNKTLPVAQWDRICGFRPGTIRQRIKTYGWDIDKAINTKVVHYG